MPYVQGFPCSDLGAYGLSIGRQCCPGFVARQTGFACRRVAYVCELRLIRERSSSALSLPAFLANKKLCATSKRVF